MTALLEIAGLRAGYQESIVLEDISLQVQIGEVVALLGANGAGKTTTMRVITGLIAALGGTIAFDGEDLSRLRAERRVDVGIALCPEGRQVFPNMSVMENLLLGSFCRHARARRAATLELVQELFPRLTERSAQKAGLMSGGEQQMLAIGRALMACPRLLLLDEPSLGLSPRMVQLVFGAVAKIAEAGISILVVEQNAQAAFSVARRGYVLAGGRVAAAGTIAELARSGQVEQAFIGTDFFKREGAACSKSGA
ncbi:MAG: ABC transporter ATP-binding protein [Alphaproteobacteria bacterium]|nr:ABC transporter ATP-binding protein [Alphaproteobacteria bacterium]